MIKETLYKLDSTGRLRTWRMELEEATGRYRTLSGLKGGKEAVSEWTTPVPKSKPTAAEQGRFEVDAQYKHQLDREYHSSEETVGTAKMIEPMLAKTYDKWPGPGFAQPKLDGIRCIATKDGLFSRQGQPIIAVPHIHEALKPLFVNDPQLTLDGELYNHDFREDFGKISSIVRKKNPTPEQLETARRLMQYHVYDLVEPQHSFEIRLHRLGEIFAENIDGVRLVPTTRVATAEEADQAYGDAVSAGYEGGMYRLDARYELGRRSKNLLKRKEFITEEFPLLAIEEGSGNWSGAAKRITLRNTHNTKPPFDTFGAGIRGSFEEGQALLKETITDKSTATVRYFMLSPDGVPRFPVVVDIQLEGRND